MHQAHLPLEFELMATLCLKGFRCIRIHRLGKSGPLANELVDLPLEVPVHQGALNKDSPTGIANCFINDYSNLGNTYKERLTAARQGSEV